MTGSHVGFSSLFAPTLVPSLSFWFSPWLSPLSSVLSSLSCMLPRIGKQMGCAFLNSKLWRGVSGLLALCLHAVSGWPSYLEFCRGRSVLAVDQCVTLSVSSLTRKLYSWSDSLSSSMDVSSLAGHLDQPCLHRRDLTGTSTWWLLSWDILPKAQAALFEGTEMFNVCSAHILAILAD